MHIKPQTPTYDLGVFDISLHPTIPIYRSMIACVVVEILHKKILVMEKSKSLSVKDAHLLVKLRKILPIVLNLLTQPYSYPTWIEHMQQGLEEAVWLNDHPDLSIYGLCFIKSIVFLK